MRLTPSGRAIVGFREQEWVYDRTTNNWEELARDLRTNQAVLAEIGAALEKPVLNNNLNYADGFNMRFGHLAPQKQLTFWIGSAAGLALHQGRHREAVESLVRQARLSRLAVEDYLAISELVRIAIASIARNATWEALQMEGWNDESLMVLQEVWAHENFVGSMAKSLEGERAFGLRSLEQMRSSNQIAYDAWYWQSALAPFSNGKPEREQWFSHLPESAKAFARKQVHCRLWRFAWSHQDERRYLEGMQLLLEVARRANSEKSLQKASPGLEQCAERAIVVSLYDQLRFPSSSQSLAALARVINRGMRADTERSATISAIALKRYSIRHGKYPVSLEALVPVFLAAVPIDYMDGELMKYRLNADGTFTLYSVGEDGRDDGGDASLLPDKKSYRNLWDRKDFVWPAPATAEEVEAWRMESAKK
jgi:hypothetical protein